MTDDRKPSNEGDEDSLVDLLRLAGHRATADPERTERVRQVAREEWERAVEAHGSRHRSRGILSLLAAAALILFIVWITVPRSKMVRTETPGPIGPVATLLTATGTVVVAERGGHSVAIEPGRTIRAGDRVETSAGVVAALSFGTGVSLRLDEATWVLFRSASDVTLERGAVYVDAQRAAGAPSLAIATRLGTARDIGTQFEVRLFDDRLRVRVRDGAVSFERDKSSQQAGRGTELVAVARGAVTTSPIAVFGADWTWTGRAAPPFRLAGRSLADFLAWVSRETGYTIAFADPQLEQAARTITLQGSISGLTAEDAPLVVLPSAGLSARVSEGVLTVSREDGGKR